MLLSGCGNSISEYDQSVPEVPKLSETTTTTAAVSSGESGAEEITTEITTSAEKEIKAGEIAYKKFSKTYQAEKQELAEGLEEASEREGFLGTGYVTGYDKDHSFSVKADLPESQYYNITVAAAADKASSCVFSINGEEAGTFKVAKDGIFEMVTFENIRLEKGETEISVAVTKGKVDLDYVKIAASSEIKDLSLGLEKYALSNKNSGEAAKALYEYLCKGYGKQVLTGQHDTVGTLTETRKIYELTGRYPAIRFGDLMPFTQDMIIGENELEYAEKWADEGGIVGYMWHWIDPLDGTSYYSDEAKIDITKAVTEESIYKLSQKKLEKLKEDGKISEECLLLMKDIDKVSKKLAELKDKGIAVLWRPLHEASNGYFWWGRDKAAYKWLWKQLYLRQTEYHKLDNLIWVWSAQNADWYVGDKYCDVISADIYDSGSTDGQVEKLLYLKKICEGKPVVMSECGTTPSIQSIADQHAFWGYIGQWGGNFLLKEDASLNEEYNTAESLIGFYSNDLTVTREELPKLRPEIDTGDSGSEETSDEESKADKADSKESDDPGEDSSDSKAESSAKEEE